MQDHSPRVQLHIQPNRSLNLRFKRPAGLRTDAVVSLDDDIMVSCSDLVRTYQVGGAVQANVSTVHETTITALHTFQHRRGVHLRISWLGGFHACTLDLHGTTTPSCPPCSCTADTQ